MCTTDKSVAGALVRQGMIPSTPFNPCYAVSIQLLELYRNLHCRCPHLAIQSFVKGLLDFHGLSYKQYYSTTFSTCYDVYLEILEQNRKTVMKELGRDAPLWRMRNACPACSYKLHGEKELIFNMLITMDGNNSLKRLRRDARNEDIGELHNERPDPRKAPGDYYLTREEVDKWMKDMMVDELSKSEPSSTHNPCASRWSNMIDQVTSRMWGVFDETGIFLALCRHGFVLTIADMVKSGELSKYPLAVVDVLLRAFGNNLGVGYDIGCKFATTIKTSPLGPLASQTNYRSLVGSFHGHAHGRLCQLSYLATYTEGLGLEDLEGCERFFSKSNALAGSVRYSSVFHRQQNIVHYMRHTDTFETYANLSKFLVNNYHQALEVLKGEATLKVLLKEHGIDDTSVFNQWLMEEKQYLENLSTEPPEETLEMDYYTVLVKLMECQDEVDETGPGRNFFNMSAADIGQRDKTRAIETKRRHVIEKRDRCLERVQELERKLLILSRWTRDSSEWAAAAEKVRLRDYRRAVDTLEGLVVSRLFELSKMNMSQTGYKLRKHIAKALQARSHTIKKALEKYNALAAACNPPAPTLSWEQVVRYGFLSDFDLLRDSRQDIHKKPWANPMNRVLREQFFKLERAREEIERLNIEIRRLITYIIDETAFLQAKEATVNKTNPLLAHQISHYSMERGRTHGLHMEQLEKLSKQVGFTGDLTPGQSVRFPNDPGMSTWSSEKGKFTTGTSTMPTGDSSGDDDDDGYDNMDDEFVDDITFKLLAISIDKGGDHEDPLEE
ncbi:hypothetical protein JOM56_001313 [Amanita muscaria]